ncbi:MAG: M20/M25/M40 family metallo-hydrolase [Alphaproteobacteria bacterium]
MAHEREALLQAIERDRERILDFYRGFIRAKSPNPPGDTREAAAHIGKLLSGEAVQYRTIAPKSEMPNIVASFEGGAGGRHLVLNGHIDVFPVGEGLGWTQDPWGAALVDGRIYGRGACDMKAGTTASIFTYLYLSRIRDKLKGKLTLTCVSDEETFGPWGARYLIEHHPEVRGDCLLNGEPSGLGTIRFGEKGPLWLAFTIRTPGAHGAYTHFSASATKIAGRLIAELEAVTRIPARAPDNVVRALEAAAPAVDAAMGKGAAAIVPKVTLNIGVIHGGLKVNMVPGECRLEADIRLPLGVEKDEVMREVRRIAGGFPEVALEEINYSAPSWCDPFGEMVEILRANAKQLSGVTPVPIVSLGGTDARLWRYKGVPAYVYGPPPFGMGSYDEHVKVEDFFRVLTTHVLSAYDYLSRG